MGFDKCMMSCIDHYSIMQSSFSAWSFSCVLLIYPSAPCFRMAYGWNLRYITVSNQFLFPLNISRSGIARSHDSSIFNFLKNLHLFSIVVIQVYIPSKGFIFSTSLPAFVITCLFDNSHANRCEVISHSLICISLVISYGEHYFMHLLPFECFLWKKSVKNSLYPFKNWVIYLFLLLSCIIFICLILDMWFKNIFLFHRLPSHFVDGFLCYAEVFSFLVSPTYVNIFASLLCLLDKRI